MIWKDVSDYEGIYQVSDSGLVRTVPGKITTRRMNGKTQLRHWSGRELKQKTDKGGYKRVTLWKNKRGKDFLVHRLVCEAFCQNYSLKPEVNHIDGNPSNNYASNLEWVTYAENLQHAYRHGLNQSPIKVVLYNPNSGMFRRFSSQTEASKFLGKNRGFVSAITKNGQQSALGYEIFVSPSN
jgi:hypothetical protein